MNAPIDLARQVHHYATSRRKEQHERVSAPVSHEESSKRAKRRKDQAFGEKLLQRDGCGPRRWRAETVIHGVAANDLTSSKLPTFAHAISKNKNNDDQHNFERGEQRVRVIETAFATTATSWMPRRDWLREKSGLQPVLRRRRFPLVLVSA